MEIKQCEDWDSKRKIKRELEKTHNSMSDIVSDTYNAFFPKNKFCYNQSGYCLVSLPSKNSLRSAVRKTSRTRERRIHASFWHYPKAFLKVNANKEELFKYLNWTELEMVKLSDNRSYHFFSAKGEFVLSNKPTDQVWKGCKLGLEQ